jgi:hypothetical protein
MIIRAGGNFLPAFDIFGRSHIIICQMFSAEFETSDMYFHKNLKGASHGKQGESR